MDGVHKACLGIGLAACLTALTACTGSSSEQVRELGDGTYAIGVRSKALAETADAVGDAARKAGAFCHARGQKLQVVTNTEDEDVRFRCVGAADLPAPESVTPQAPEKEETH